MLSSQDYEQKEMASVSIGEMWDSVKAPKNLTEAKLFNIKQYLLEPDKAHKHLIKTLIEKLFSNLNIQSEEQLSQATLAYPAVWQESSMTAIDFLKQVVNNQDGVNEVSLVPEPAAAAAYHLSKCPEQYRNGTQFLVIDFGANSVNAHSFLYKKAKSRY